MYFKFQKAGTLLQVDDNFAHLYNVTEQDEYEFEFIYIVSQREAISRGATKVRVSVEVQPLIKPSIFDNTTKKNKSSNATLALNIQQAVQNAKLAAITHMNHVLIERVSDITAYVNNDIMAQLSAKMSSKQITSLNKTKLLTVSAVTTKNSNDQQPILHRVSNSSIVPDVKLALSASADENPQQLMLDMIGRQGIDPSHVVNLAPRSSSEQETRSGLTNFVGGIELQTDPLTRLFNHYLFPPTSVVPPTTTDQLSDSEFVTVLQNLPNDFIAIPVCVTLSKKKLDALSVNNADRSTVNVKFELLDTASEVPIDNVVKQLDITKHIRIYYTPKVAPRVNAASSESSSRANLEIKQLDSGATEVLLYKKPIWIASTRIEDYTLVGTYDLKSSEQSLLVQVDQPKYTPVIYRVVPRGKQSMLGFEYSNVILKPAKFLVPKAISLSVEQVDIGIKIELRKIPSKVVSVQFLRWNLTFFEKEYTVVNTESMLVNEDIIRLDMISTVDSAVTPGNTYKYAARLIYANGDNEIHGSAIVELIKPAPGSVDIKISDLIVSHDSNMPNVTFNIQTRTIDSDIDAVKRMLENQGLISYFENDIITQRDQLRQLIAHSITRIDLSTGQSEYFGVITEASFDDNALRKNHAINALEYGHKYRYEIYPLLRAPETMFDQYIKESTDAVTKKTYRWKPSKYLHPLTLSRGVLVSTLGAKKRYGKEPMTYGILGAPTNVEVSFDTDTATIVDAEAAIFDRYINIVTWRMLGNTKRVDHFLIFKEVHGVRTLLGKAHSEFEYGSCQYLHNVKERDTGALKYVIIPIMNDYKEGVAASTNTLIVESS